MYFEDSITLGQEIGPNEPPFEFAPLVIPDNATVTITADFYANTIDTSPPPTGGTLSHFINRYKMRVRKHAGIFAEIAPYAGVSGEKFAGSGNYGIDFTLALSEDKTTITPRLTGVSNRRIFMDCKISWVGRIEESGG